MRKIFFDENSQKEFEQQGYIKVSLLSKDEIDSVLKELWQLTPDDNFNPKGKDGLPFSFHCTNFDTNLEYRKKANELLRQTFTAQINKHLIDYKMMINVFFIKPPGKGELEFHQDITITEDLNQRNLVVWCPLIDVTEQNGTLYIVEGSYKIVPNLPVIGQPWYFSEFLNTFDKDYVKSVLLKAGEALIYDTNMIHGSPDNFSDSVRCSAQFLCIPAEAKPLHYHLDWNNPDNLEVFEVESEDFYIETTIPSLLFGRPSLKSTGFIKRNYKTLTEDEFVSLLKSGDEIKPKLEVLSEMSLTEPVTEITLSSNSTAEAAKVDTFRRIKRFLGRILRS